MDILLTELEKQNRVLPDIQAILFDFGGVIAEEGFYNALIDLAHEQALDASSLPNEAMDAVYDSGFVLGKGTEHAFWSLLRQRTGLQGDDEELTRRVLTGFQLRPAVINLVRKLRSRGYITGILSDQTHWLNTLDDCDHFFEEFDVVYNSYVLGKGKRDETVFIDVLKQLKLLPQQVLFIDDNEMHTRRAQSQGLNTIHYRDISQFMAEIESKLSEVSAT